VQEKYPETVEFIRDGAHYVLIVARDMVHMGAKLLNHPLSGVITPGASPYKTLVVSRLEKKGSAVPDFGSLSLIEGALGAVQKSPGGRCAYDYETLVDFQVIDLDMLDSAMGALGGR